MAQGDDMDAAELKKLTPEDLFRLFDTDMSGSMDLEEFKVMLDRLGVRMAPPKALKYFKMCDQDSSGEITLDEFKIALFATDPINGNEIGFSPTALLAPLDVFEMFDEDASGTIDEDEFAFIMEYMRVPLTDQKIEALFMGADKDTTGAIDYEAFKQVWLRVCDVAKELEDRGVEVPKFATARQRQKMLGKLVDDEEEAERHAMAEAQRFRDWQKILEQKNVHIKKARRRAQIELSKALDAAGQVYVFGRGSLRQFDGEVAKNAERGMDVIQRMWLRRVTAGAADINRSVGTLNGLADRHAVDVDSLTEELAGSHFKDLTVAQNTCILWGRRVVKVAISDTVILALSDLGDMWTWGGSDHWWYEIEPGAAWQTEWRGDTTPRSQLLLGTADLTAFPVREDTEEEGGEEDAEAKKHEAETEKLKVVLTYFDSWSPPPPGITALRFYEEQCLPKVDYGHMKMSLEVRGKTAGDATKATLARMLHRDMELERRVLGERAHRRIHELEEEILDLERRRKRAMATRLKAVVNKMWAPLREIQAEEDGDKRAEQQTKLVETVAKRERTYQRWRHKVEAARRQMTPKLTPRGNSIAIEPGSITTRGAKKKFSNRRGVEGYAAVRDITAGSQHLGAVHMSGQLYTWGLGASGRLGLDVTQNGDPRADAARPTLVQALEAVPIVAMAAGHSHNAAVSAARDLYMWGSASSGKLGVGDHAKEAECYSSIPLRVKLSPSERLLVRHVSCGAAHSAAVSTDGALFVWGCGDGGRLGLGLQEHGFETVWRPRRVDRLSNKRVRIAHVACGNACTLATTVVEEQSESAAASFSGQGNDDHHDDKKVEGGDVYVAGPAAVLGADYPRFTRLRGVLDDVAVVQVAAGFSHQAARTNQGELYLWGVNSDACCAQPPSQRFVAEPALCGCMYERPKNIALHRPCKMSSCYGGLDADIAVDGNCDGSHPSHCASTQQDAQAWLEVDLGEEALVDYVTVWNRTDAPRDKTQPRDKFSSRLVPSWLMASQRPYSDEIGGDSLKLALHNSLARMQLTRDQRSTTWKLPDNIRARYVRLQLESFDFLHIAQLEVFGNYGLSNSVGRCAFVECGKHVTGALVHALTDPQDMSRLYRRATLADAQNADILRERETFALEYDKYGRGGGDNKLGSCAICTEGLQCEICTMKSIFREDLDQLPLGVAGRVLTLDETAEMLLNAPKPALKFKKKEKVDNSVAGALKRRLANKNNMKAHDGDTTPREQRKETPRGRAKLFSRTKKQQVAAIDEDPETKDDFFD